MRAVYLLVLAACLLGTLPLEVWLRARVYRRPLRLAATLLPVAAVFGLWDAYAIAHHHWSFDPRQTLGLRLGNVPLEEVLFFLAIPTCAILTLEAVRRITGWQAGDERPGRTDGARRPRARGRVGGDHR